MSEGVSIDQNGLSSQIRRPVGSVGGSNDEQPSSNVGAKSTRSVGRSRKPSQKALDAKESAAVSKADRIKRTNPRDQKNNTDFNCPQSINENFPPHRGKGQSNVPRWWLTGYHSNDAKARRVREWRMFTTKQQKEKISEHWKILGDSALSRTNVASSSRRVSTESVVDEETRKKAAKEAKRLKKIRVSIEELSAEAAREVTYNDGVHFSATNIEYSQTCLSEHRQRQFDALDLCLIALEEKEEESARKKKDRDDRRNEKRRNNRARQREQTGVSIVLVLVSFVIVSTHINLCSRMFLSMYSPSQVHLSMEMLLHPLRPVLCSLSVDVVPLTLPLDLSTCKDVM